MKLNMFFLTSLRTFSVDICYHYNYITVGVMVSQLTSNLAVYLIILLIILFALTNIKKNHQSSVSLALCEGNSPVTGEFPTQKASKRGNNSI